MKVDITKEIVLEVGISAQINGTLLTLKGPKGEVKRDLVDPKITLMVHDGKIILKAIKATKREKTILGSFNAHIKNMIKGVQKPHLYQLKVCAGHFPMSVGVVGHEFVVKNFLGESVPRKAALLPGVIVKVDGTIIEVSSPDIELAGQMAARIESLCRITNRDRRIFQDGCYIVNKAGKSIN